MSWHSPGRARARVPAPQLVSLTTASQRVTRCTSDDANDLIDLTRVCADFVPALPRRLVNRVKDAIEHGVNPRLNAKGSSGSYFAKDASGTTVGIFKPKDEEVRVYLFLFLSSLRLSQLTTSHQRDLSFSLFAAIRQPQPKVHQMGSPQLPLPCHRMSSFSPPPLLFFANPSAFASHSADPVSSHNYPTSPNQPPRSSTVD